MKTTLPPSPRSWLAALALSLLLAACGGGGGDSAALADPTAAPATRPVNPTVERTNDGALVVNTVPIAPPTAQDCTRLTSAAQSAAALDLSDPMVRAVHDELLAIDPVHAYPVFVRMPAQFVNWIALLEGTLDMDTIGFATHETMHNLSYALGACSPQQRAAYLVLGTTVDSGLRFGETANYSIVAETIAPELTSHFRYTEYIPSAAAANGNDLRILLDELAAYVGSASTEQRYIASGRAGNDRRVLEYNLGGTVNFMVFLQHYLLSARLNHPQTYAAVRANPTTLAAIQFLWTTAEDVLQASYPLTVVGSVPRLDYSRAYFAAAYSPALLAELDALGIAHRSAESWRTTYLR